MQAHNKTIHVWLTIVCIMIVMMIALGGITRLTQSGLSMTSWKFSGSLPPLNETEWETEFQRYRASPEYRLINHQYNVEEFKQIYWWEYAHRFTGRATGLVYLLPLLYFIFRSMLTRALAVRLSVGFVLILLQGVLGWLMVKSGLKQIPHVDHFLLSAHLTLALITLVYVFQTLLRIRRPTPFIHANKVWKKTLTTAFILVSIQIILGAWVAGLKAGLLYNTYPLMGNNWLPQEIFSQHSILQFISDGACVQFMHRMNAILVVASVVFLLVQSGKRSELLSLRKSTVLLTVLVTVQFLLGVYCILFMVPVTAGAIHQLCAVAILLNLVYIRHESSARLNTNDSVKQHAQTD